ncbi:hypothetical protein GCM10027046_04270 [Uliginosibacterium flavum]
MACAIAIESFKTRCALEPTEEQKNAYDQAVIDGVSGGQNNPTAEQNREQIDVGSAFSGVSELFPSSCIEDINFSVVGQSVSISMQPACYWLSVLGYVGVMASIVCAALIVGKT